jgi:ATP-dependent RNA helicase DeaD
LLSIDLMGFQEATPIQEKAIPPLLAGRDLLGQAQTGTGKTLAFAIPCLEKIDLNNPRTQALILCPTRELVMQVTEEFRKLIRNRKDLTVFSIYGGQDIKIQLKALKKACHIVVGTPGRIQDHLRRRSLRLDDIKYLVLDEADQMLDMGFAEDMKNIISQTPRSRQTLMFSATMPKRLELLMNEYLKEALKVTTIDSSTQNQQIKQLYFPIKNTGKLEALGSLLTDYRIQSGIVFCNTRLRVDELSKKLSKMNYKVAALHGNISQSKRIRALQAFKNASIELLVATDVAARGLDIKDLEAVINYDLPKFDQDYVHRIGRTGRAGKQGLALSLVAGRGESDHINRIARKNNLKIERAGSTDQEESQNLQVKAFKERSSMKFRKSRRSSVKSSSSTLTALVPTMAI